MRAAVCNWAVWMVSQLIPASPRCVATRLRHHMLLQCGLRKLMTNYRRRAQKYQYEERTNYELLTELLSVAFRKKRVRRIETVLCIVAHKALASHRCASARHSDIKSSRKCMHVCCICAAAAIVYYETVRVELSNDGHCETCAGASR